ncbi:Acetyltransferase (GNAT) family protein [Rosistilla oblonga]|uniref:GNAT family N-acetyltransferase n=1 Tax=Rosistilla oblonga TaxID=2527990 RepID=UPI00118BF5B1|nr:GNAT family protein [Rosistilla oblonga]QDV11925.1 Acetyltransferase (GNAT) family protein [Rosistilla oblonga]
MPPPTTDQIVLRDATMDDLHLLMQWRNHPATRNASRNTAAVDHESHQKWMQHSLGSDKRMLLIAEIDCRPIGTVRLDLDEVSEISWTVAPEARGKGLGKRMVMAAVGAVKSPIKAVTRSDNTGSQKIAEAAGFRLIQDDGRWRTYYRDLTTQS